MAIDRVGGVWGLAAALKDSDGFVEFTIDAVRTEVRDAYETVPTESLVASVQRNRELACRVLVEGVVPPSEEIWEAEFSTLERLQQGVEIQDIMGGFRVVIRCIQSWIVEHATEHRVEANEALRLSQLLWRLSDAFSARAAVAYRHHGIARSIADEQRRVDWVTGLLGGTLSAAELDQGCVMYQVRREQRVYAACTAPVPDRELQQLQQELSRPAMRSSLGHDPVTMLVPADGGLVGFTTMPPADAGVVVALGPVCGLDDLHNSFQVAKEVLAAACLRAGEGVYTLDTLTWRAAVPGHRAVNALLHARYIEPLCAQGGFGELVIEALETWLSHSRSIPKAAESIPVHVNTLRYRLARFEELTGRSLEDTDTLIELSWALFARSTFS
ncbi:PucR family transcriptional regulator [Nocardia xishanensis]